MQRIGLAIVFGLALARVAQADMEFRRHDCSSPGEWFNTNAQTLVALVDFAVPSIEGPSVTILGQRVGVAPSAAPWGASWGEFNWAGIAGGAGHLFLSLGGSVGSVVNAILHLGCMEYGPVEVTTSVVP